MRPVAHIAHRTVNRTRIRIPSKRGDDAFFRRVRDWLSSLEGIRDVRINALTASMLIHHDACDPATFHAALGQSEMFDLGDLEGRYEALLDGASRELRRLDDRLSRVTAGGLDVPGGLFVFFLLGALIQAARGQVLGPASSLLWSAYEILRHRGRASA